jgi:hypothetical protein
MVFPFGVSVGDFIAGVTLIYDTIRTLSDTHGASSDYRSLMATLESLNSALREIDSLPSATVQTPQRIAIQTEIEGCRQCVNKFIAQISKFSLLKDPIQSKWSLKMLQSNVKKLQWTLLKQDDIARFRAEVYSRVDSIQMLLLTFQMYVNPV